MEELPDSVIATMEARDRLALSLSQGGPDDVTAFLIDQSRQWIPSQTVRVAFLGGDAALHADIAEATKQITENCNIKFDFGFNPQANTFRTWTRNDQQLAAEIRVSFDLNGFFSLVGTDSISPIIGQPSGPIGGRANQTSLNLSRFHLVRPANWQGVVRHEFLHAIAFHHEHQNPLGPCETEFRWDDDPGYVPTIDANSQFIADGMGHRPGIYTYLSGAPNFWNRAKVDFNLRRVTLQPGLEAGSFDSASVMLYRFPALFYRSSPSPCAPTGDGINLSADHIKGLLRLYPTDPMLMAGGDDLRQRASRQLDQAQVPRPLKDAIKAQVLAGRTE